jgi:hypothetical protein
VDLSILEQISAAGVVKTTRELDLGDCDEAYRGAIFRIWVTPTRAHWAEIVDYRAWLLTEPARRQAERDKIEDAAERAEFDRVVTERLEREMNSRLDAWLAETWTNIERDEVTQIREHLQENNPAAWDWLYLRTLRTIRDYRENLTKN